MLFLATRAPRVISTAVSMLAKFQSNPVPLRRKAMKYVVRYLKGTETYGLIYRRRKKTDQMLTV